MDKIVSIILLLFVFTVQAEERVLTFGIVPQQSAQVMAKAWNPILAHLSEKTGQQYRFVTAPSIPEFEKRCAAGEYDIAYMNPYHYTVFSENPGYRAFANQANKKIQGIVVVRKDSPIKRLDQLNEKPMAFPAPAAFAASVLPRAFLGKNNISIKSNYVYSHDAVYKTVAAKNFVAGGGIFRTFNKVDPAIKDQLRVLWTTDKYTPHAFAAHPRVAADVVDKLSNAMADLNETEAGQTLLKPIGFSSIQQVDDSQWNDVRELNIKLLDRLVKG